MSDCQHPELTGQSMKRNLTWADAPSYPLDWAGERPSVRAVCASCGAVVVPPKPQEETTFDWDEYDRHVDELIADATLRDGLKQEARIRADAERALIAAGHADWREEFGMPNTRAYRES